MVAVDDDRAEARAVPNLGMSLLPTAGIYGPNASGKSNVLAALNWLREAVGNSLLGWDDRIPVEPFAFNEGPVQSSDFTIEFIIGGVRFEYVVQLDENAVHYEGLFHYPEKKRRRIFERERLKLTLQRGLGHLSGTRELLTNRTLALSIARRFDEHLVSDFTQALLNGQTIWPRSQRPFPYSWTQYWFKKSLQQMPPEMEDLAQRDRAEALAMLRMADLGIDDVIVDKAETPRQPDKFRLVHRTADGKSPLDFTAESEGTRTWFALIGPVLAVLRSGTVMLLDELDAGLHPTLSAQLIRLFHDPATNPAGAQLIFTSHDTSLLNHLNRDEVWLTEKLDDGTTRLGALAEFAGERVRKSQNLERAYLHGRFGALPDVDRTAVLRALGLIG